MIACEATRSGRQWPRVANWWTRAFLLNGVQVGIVYAAGLSWDKWMSEYRPWNADGLGVVGGTVVGYLAITFLYYWWHRWRHQSALLWRLFHQVHHSPQRIEIITSFYKHPFEILANGLLSSTILYFLVGVSPEVAAYTVLITGLAELFYHWNVPTPYWLGFIIQRPESHCVHHQDGLHAYNYGDLPIYDMLFGTFRNPRKWQERCGFGEEEHRLGEMLRCRDVAAAQPGDDAV
ncbi:MAG: sterol desaturase family protein [Planctomycetes bacterium]|nr:sterol desaturase family protein [Planctomycetota bacterium]